MKSKISILGCGWLGMPLATSLVQKGFKVKGSTTSTNKLEVLESKGISPFLVNLDNLEKDISTFLSSETLIILIPSKNMDGFKELIHHIEGSIVKKVLFISSTSVYPNTNGVVTEETPVKVSPLSEIELLFKSNAKFESTIVRFGGLFGYDRKPGNFIPTGRKLANPEGFVNLIHQDDCLRIIEKIIEQNCWNETLNACADTHPKRKDFYKKEMIKVGRSEPDLDENSLNEYKIVSSEKLKTMLDFSFEYPDLMAYED